MEQLEINAGELTLRPWHEADAEAIVRACADPEIRRWTRYPPPATRAEATAFVAESHGKWADGVPQFGVFDATSGELLGYHGFASPGEIAFWTAPWARGRRVAERSGRALLRWAFAELSLTRAGWHAEIGNHGSRLVAERLGFTIDGLARALAPNGRAVWHASLLAGELREEGAAGPFRSQIFVRRQPSLPAGGAHLRSLEDRDVDAITKTCIDAESARWTTIPVPYERADAEWFLREHRPWDYQSGAVFAICGPDDAYAGSMELRLHPTDTGRGDVGFVVAPWARGRGWGTAALTALADWAIPTFDLRRLEWRAYLGNDASRRVAEKAGFVFEGTLRAALLQRGTPRDAWLAARTP